MLVSRRIGRRQALPAGRLTAPAWTRAIASVLAAALPVLAGVLGASAALAGVPLRDGPNGMTCHFYAAGARLEWSRTGGDWIDRDGSRHGDAPFGTATIAPAQQPQTVRLDVTSVARAWERAAVPGGVYLRAMGGQRSGIANVSTREHADPEARPNLEVAWSDGHRDRLEAIADTYFACPTHSSLGRRKMLQIGSGYDAVLVFPSPRRPGQRIVSAHLLLASDKQYGGGATIGAFLPAPPFGGSAVTPGIAAAYAFDAGIEDHPDVLFAERFERPDWKRSWSDFDPNGDAEPVRSDLAANRFQPLDGRALKVTIREGRRQGLSMHYRFAARNGSEPEEIYFRYHLRFADNWNPAITGGKMPGLAGTYERAGWGGRSSDGVNGWSARGAFFQQQADDPAFEGLRGIGSYLYHPQARTKYGDPIGWNLGPTGYLEKNRWYSVEQYVKLNRPGSSDGELRAWIDGMLVYERTGMRYRDVPELKVETVWMNIYHGGTAKARQDLSVYLDNVVVARRYIGPAGPRK